MRLVWNIFMYIVIWFIDAIHELSSNRPASGYAFNALNHNFTVAKARYGTYRSICPTLNNFVVELWKISMTHFDF